IPEVHQDPITHVFRYEAGEALHGLCNAPLVSRNDFAEVFRVHAGGEAVEPTRSESITVTWRRSARASGGALGALDVLDASTEDALLLASLRRAAMASSSFTRCPIEATPSSFRISCVKPGRTVSSMSFSRNAASYFPRPRLRSQTTMSMMARPIQD